MANSKYSTNTSPAGCGHDDSAKLPKRLSPSRAQDFIGCPAKFYFKSILKVPSYATEATAKGTLAHAAFEKLFDHPREDRTPETAIPYVAPEWARLRQESNYKNLVAAGPDAELALVSAAEELVRRYFDVERPWNFDPVGREQKIMADIGGVPLLGILDRVDRITLGGKEQYVISDYKGLALDTLLPTPTGWTTMGTVKVGDKVFGPDGLPTAVTIKSDVHHRPCYRVVFDDGAVIVCDNVHLWEIQRPSADPAGRWVSSVVDADELYDLHHHTPLRVKATAPIVCKTSPADADPAEVAFKAATIDDPVLVGTMFAFVRGSVEQRHSIIDGISTSDACYTVGDLSVFSHSDPIVCATVHEVLSSLGVPARIDGATVTWETGDRFSNPDREIVSVEPTDSVPTQCIAVDNDSHLYLAGAHMVPTHNTGKVPAPDDRYLSDKFFGMRTYALLLEHEVSEMPTMLRLIFVAGGTPGSVRKENVTPQLLKAHKKLLQDAYRRMKSSAKTGEWETKQQPLCLYCDHMSYCPGWHEELAGLEPGDLLPEEVQVEISSRPARVDEPDKPSA